MSRTGPRAVRGLLLWAARAALGNGTPYPGRIRVRVAAPDEGIEIRIDPTAAVDGTAPPGEFAFATVGEELARLTAAFLSEHEKLILRELAQAGPCKAQDVQDGTAAKVNRNAFWTLWANLQHRGLVAERDDGRFEPDDGRFEPAGEWVRAVAG
jgi:hypothetical protein